MRQLFCIFSSLRLTVLLLACSVLLVFWGTLAQVDLGIHEVQRRFFESFTIFLPVIPWHGHWLHFPFPGGYTIGTALLINLACAHFRYFCPSWKKIGIVLIHGGLAALIISGFLTSLLQVESQLWVSEGEKINYSESSRDNELVIIDTSNPEEDTVISIPLSLIKEPGVVEHAALPFQVESLAFFPNADLGLRSQNPNTPPTLATRGAGVKMDIAVMPKPVTYKDNEPNTATAYIKLTDADGEMGTWLVSNMIDERFPAQTFEHGGKTYRIALRFKRYYTPYWIELVDFNHDRYPGTNIPRNFSSQVRIVDPEASEERPVLISMNHPLRYGGLTYYQAAFANSDTTSILQVVKNPSWRLPYFAVLAIGLGLITHFAIHLITFLRKR
ncbi:MAG TPA: ResB protein required for cytochrome C biosynthesis [Opitutae bacterium]|nr:ResB protein required for cytochrome C biosynthesis [Opitutae bacterium]|tara:strand:- start:495 stop:1652 length:1158 start_codon:yes stop_codon:yes gene_type:complete